MITIKISFLLAIDLLKPAVLISEKPGKKNKKQKKTPKSPKSKPPKKKTKQTEEKPEVLDDPDKNYSAFEIEEPISCVHVDYDLFGKKFKYGVDVICWGPVAKIFTRDGNQSVKTVIKNEIAWIPVFVEHYLTELSNEEIQNMTVEAINLKVNTGKNSMGNQAKQNKTKVFYLHQNDANNEYFPEVSEEKPKGSEEAVKEIVERILKKVSLFPVKSDVVSWIYDRNDVHAYKIAKIVTKRSNSEEVPSKDYNKVETKIKDKPKGKSKKKDRKKTDETSGKIEVNIPSHVLLSDPNLATYHLHNIGSNLKEVFILFSTDNILSPDQKNEMCPLVVKVRKINCLPVNILKQNGFQEVFVSFHIPGIYEFESSRRSLGGRLIFDESRFIITTDIDRMNILEVLETRRAIAKIIGVKTSTETSDVNESKPQKSKKKKGKSKDDTKKLSKMTETVILAVSTFDLSPLANSFYLFKEKAQCYNVRALHLPTPLFKDHLLDRVTNNEVHFCNIDKNDLVSPLSDNVLFSEGTTLKFEAHFLYPVHPLFYIKDTSTKFRRLLVILYKEEIAKELLAFMVSSNSRYLSDNPIPFPNFFLHYKTEPELETSKILSGFFLDDGSEFIFFIEGPSVSNIQTIVHRISEFDYKTARVFFNSDYIYEERLYPMFQECCGIFMTNLRIPFVELFAQKKIYLEGNLPYHCFKTIQKLNLIMNSGTFHSILSHDLLPTEIELLSFSIEFCFQFKYKVREVDKTEVKNTRSSVTDFGSRYNFK